MEKVMDPSGPDSTEVRGILLAMQKNLECPICLEIMKTPVSTQCAHVFCSFCILKLLEQKKGVTKCPLCNCSISKSTLQEDVRFKLVIKAVLEAIGALECDPGSNFVGDQCLPKKAAVLQEKQIVIESKGYRGRLDGVKKVEKKNSALQNKNSCLPLPKRTATRRSLIKKNSSNKTVYFEIGSDSSEDLVQKTRTVRCEGRRKSSQSRDGERHAEKQSQCPRHLELQEPNGKEVVLLDTPEACGLSEAGRDVGEGTRASPRNGDAVKENVAVEKRQDSSFPVPGIREPSRQLVSGSAQEDNPCSSPSMERSQVAVEATEPDANKQAGNGAEMMGVAQPAGSAHLEDEQELQQPQAAPQSPLNPVSGKKLNQSIQKVSEWLLSSKDANAEDADDLNPYLSDVDSPVFRETKLMEDQWEVAAGHEVGRTVSKPVASGMVDKIFGRTYQRTRKSSRIRIPAEENGVAVDTDSCDTPLRKIPAHKKVALELTPEDTLKKQTAMEVSEGTGSNANAVLGEDGDIFAPGTMQRPAELPVKEEAPGFEWPNSKKPRSSLSRRSQRRGKPVCLLQAAVQGTSGSPEKAQPDGNPTSEGSWEDGSIQVHIRRSKRLLSRAEGEQGGNEPAKKRRNQMGEGEKQQKETQAAEGGPSALQGLQVGVAGDASEACAFLDGEGSLSAEHLIERGSPCHIVPGAASQDSCLLLQHLVEEEESDFQVEKSTAAPQAEKSAMGSQALEGEGCRLQEVKKSPKSPKVHDEATGNPDIHPETEDSELDPGFIWKVFHRCKRQSFLLHPAPSKELSAGTQTELSPSRAEDSEAHFAKETTPGPATVSKVRREATSGSESRCSQVVSQAAFPNSLCMLVTGKEAERGNLLQSPEPASNKKGSPEMGKTSDANSCRCGSTWRRGSFQSTNLHPADEMSFKTTPFLETRPESDGNKAVACSFCQSPLAAYQPRASKSRSGSVESKSGVAERLAQSPKDETPDFALLSDTPDGLLGPATKSSPNPWEVGQQDALAVFVQTDEGSPLERDLEGSSSGSGSGLASPVRAQRRRVQKLSSSKEEDSSEEEELPCFQELVCGRSASTPSQLIKEEEEESAEIPTQRSNSRCSPKSQGGAGSPSLESEGSVDLFSSQSHASEDSASRPCGTRLLTPVPISLGEGITPRTAIEPLDNVSRDAGLLHEGNQDGINAEPNLEGRGNGRDSSSTHFQELKGETLGYDSEVSHLGDSSGFSSQSEILTTQQKDAMQNNLRKLQQEMAVLQAALKDGGQDAATEGVPPPPDEGSVSMGGPMSSARGGLPAIPESPMNTRSPEPVLQQGHEPGSTSQLRCGSRQSILTASPPAGSMPRTPDDCSTSSSMSQEHVPRYLAAEPEEEPSVVVQDVRSAPEHEHQGRPSSSSAATTICSGRKGNSKSLHSTSKRNMSLVASGLYLDELRLVQKFAKKTKSTWSHTISKDTTHVIMKTDEDLVCERTLKYFLGIAARKWVVSYQWVLQSLKEGIILNEGNFEVRGDIINGRNHQGPKRARESPAGQIFQGLEICCYGPFTDMQREQLEWMVELCGASLVKQPHSFSHSTDSAKAVVVVQPDAWEEDPGCQGIPRRCSATVVAREWVLDSVASYQRMAFDDYIVQQA